MEVPRMLLAIAGKFPSDGAYEDGRYTTDEAAPDGAKPFASVHRTLAANLGRMPVVHIRNDPSGLTGDRASIGQSNAINFYIASTHGLMGGSPLEAARIVGVQEHIKEMYQAFRKIVPYGQAPTNEQKDAWFEGGASDRSPDPSSFADRDRRFPWWAERLEAVVGLCPGHESLAVGSALSLADVLVYNAFAEVMTDAECAGDVPAWKREPFCDKARTDKALARCPKLRAICASVAKHPGVQRWLRERGVQRF
jgi:glutathione S-transferase